MTARPTLLLKPDGSRDATGIITPTLTGGVLTVPGQYGNAWQVAEATTNYSPPIDGDSTPRVSGPIWQVTTPVPGVRRAEIPLGGPNSTYLYVGAAENLPAGLTEADRFTLSFEWRSSKESNLFDGVQCWSAANASHLGYSSYVSNTTTLLPDGWKRTVIVVIPKANTWRLAPIIGAYAPGMWFEVRKIQIERKAYATPYADGSMGAGHAWIGTAYAAASASTRAGAQVQASNAGRLSTGPMAIAVRARVTPPASGSTQGFWFANNSGAWPAGPYMCVLSDGRIYLAPRGNGAGGVSSPPVVSGTHTFLMQFDGVAQWEGYMDGVLFGTKTLPPNQLPAIIDASNRFTTVDGVVALVESMLLFDRFLPADEIAEIMAYPGAWDWGRLAGDYSIASFLSGMSAFDTDVYVTDRNNSVRTSISSAVTSVQPDWDIDRSGSKSSVAIETHQPVLTDGMWIAPYIKITPEVGDVTEQQVGHFRLATPGAMIDGSVDYDGVAKVVQTASGSDIVDDIARARLAETFYTPVGGLVMLDVENLIRLATCGVLGANLVTNGSFEDGLTGWPNGASAGANAPASLTIAYATDGAKLVQLSVPAGSPAGSEFYMYQDVTIRPGTAYMVASLMAWSSRDIDEYFRIEWRTASAEISRTANVVADLAGWGRWQRLLLFSPVPMGATVARLAIVGTTRAGGSPLASLTYIDDVQLRTCTSMPLPVDRISLPPSGAYASTRIQTTSGKSFAYHAINADRLAAIGHHALYTTLDGRLTTSPVRDIASATPSRQYGRDDYRLVGTVETERSATNRHNHYIAIKEDNQDATNTLVANAYNRDPDDPWSTLNMPLSSADPIMVQDAVSQEALQAVADAALARASEQEILRIQVLPDPALTVHSVIEIIDSALPEAVGKWLVESITPGMRADSPLVEIGARRTRRAGGSY